ncbi:hypothetical protein [Roseisolibacter sp. H3M3-2]|uniref:hypothetical protein n=1 Tax=Roseisolibacter sp. H3M3-2 TaxID=3031323 RepID=UPI0023DC06BB|nr:hypothetical protein [Roseisolibacter sp. H3M3-2]MDF1502968.1 hypothetical protein [Roseisolibacter sp. H3M3-2]
MAGVPLTAPAIERFGEYVRVSGLPDGDWWVLTGERGDAGQGIAGAEHAWVGSREGRIHLLHLPTRRVDVVTLEGMASWGWRPEAVAPSRDGRRLYVVEAQGRVRRDADRLHVVDLRAASVTTHAGLPSLRWVAPVERPDGALLIPTLHGGLLLIDAATGAHELSEAAPGAASTPFLTGSPDGRWWVRVDPASPTVHDEAPGLLARLLDTRKQAVRRYGVAVQLWEALPLRLARRAVVAWLPAEDLPNETDLLRMTQRPPAFPTRAALWDTIAATLGGRDAITAPPRAAWPPAVAGDDGAWRVVEQNLDRLQRGGWVRVVGWQPDGAALWLSINNFLVCVGTDGTTSPLLHLERHEAAGGGAAARTARGWERIAPLEGRRARVTYAKGEATLDGTPAARALDAVAVAAARDGWRPRAPDDPEATARKAAWRTVEAMQEQRRRVVVPLAAWTAGACAAAIDAVAAEVRAGLATRAVDGEVHVVFAAPDGEADEARFFGEVAARFPEAAPALRRLVEAMADAGGALTDVFSDGDAGAGALAHAVRALGVLDGSALRVVRRYGEHVDAEHELFFTGETLPAVVAAHGWTDAVVDLVLWALAWNFYNSLQDYGTVWRAWGLRDALVARDPVATARHVAADLAGLRGRDAPGRYGVPGLEKLARQIPQPHEPWAAAFFGELERLAGDPGRE